MSEDNKSSQPEDKATSETVKKAPARKKAASKTAASKPKSAAKTSSTRKTATRKPAAKKASTSKAATASKATKASAEKANQPVIEDVEVIELVEDTVSSDKKTDEKASTEQSDASSSHADFLNDLQDRDWSYIAKRGLMMVFYGIIAWLTIGVALTLVFVHFIVAILLDGPHKELSSWINTCGSYLRQIFSYLSYKTDDQPFPLGSLPNED
ncbi:hypothetical protein GCM10017044_22980 [Kordiimonas sediminis]|uniref:DUF4389 domain-containing protein n=1 Tax=Kordiimonas sediminis TaxID=1735581 RepID=A0A919AX52_9PROT|nr:DUF4389 domain-containing protein [Kordiimonas sediminis]GHF27336.1 hypothetical protein GCM10017044_22980 [Kordiimonas sediminis]